MGEADEKAKAYFASQKANQERNEEQEREHVLRVLKQVIDFITETLKKLDYPVDKVPVQMADIKGKKRAVWGIEVRDNFGLLADGTIIQKRYGEFSVLNPVAADLHLLKKFVLYDLDMFVVLHLAELSGTRNKKTEQLPGYPHDEIEQIQDDLRKRLY